MCNKQNPRLLILVVFYFFNVLYFNNLYDLFSRIFHNLHKCTPNKIYISLEVLLFSKFNYNSMTYKKYIIF